MSERAGDDRDVGAEPDVESEEDAGAGAASLFGVEAPVGDILGTGIGGSDPFGGGESGLGGGSGDLGGGGLSGDFGDLDEESEPGAA